MTTLRDYQQKALDEIRSHYAKGEKRVLLHLATGGGKTIVFSEVLKGVISKGKKAIMVVRGKDLIEQTSQRLMREGVPHGCLQANHWNYNPTAPIQICSVDTLFRRKLKPEANLVVIDECHLSRSPSFEWVISQYPDAFFLPVSATPHHKKGLRHIADIVVYPITIKDLIEQRYLSRPRYFMPTKIDLSSVSIDRTTSDYNIEETAAALVGSTVYGDIISQYKKLCHGKSAVAFAVNIEHSKIIVEMFLAEGISAEHVEANTPAEHRASVISRLKSGETKVVSNVGILTTGVDLPFLEVVILARPTKSYNLYIQACGRGTRVTDTKSEFLILDHTNNISEHGFIEDEKLCSLDPIGKKVKKHLGPIIVTCMNCYGTFEYEKEMKNDCPLCGHSMKAEHSKAKKILAERVEAELIEVSARAIDLKWTKILRKIDSVISHGYKKGSVYYWCKDNFGQEYANEISKRVEKEFKSRNYNP